MARNHARAWNVEVVYGTPDFIDLKDPVNEEDIGLGLGDNVTISVRSEQ